MLGHALAHGGALLASQVYQLYPKLFGLTEDATVAGKQVGAAILDSLPVANYWAGTTTTAELDKLGRTWAATRFNAVSTEDVVSVLKGALPYIFMTLHAYQAQKSGSAKAPIPTDVAIPSVMDYWDSMYSQAVGGMSGAAVGASAGAQGMSMSDVPSGTASGYFHQTAMGHVRPASKTQVIGPDGRDYWFGYLGKPLLFSGDVAAARRVERVVKKISKVVGYKAVRRGTHIDHRVHHRAPSRRRRSPAASAISARIS